MSIICERVKIIKELEYNEFMVNLEREIRDMKDITYLAVAICKKADGIWTHDPHLKDQSRVKIYTNIDLLKLLRKDESLI